MIISTLDIETIYPTWEGDREKFPPLPYHVPVVICWMLADTSDMSIKLKTRSALKGNNYEPEAMGGLAEDLVHSDVLVTFNGRNFDMPLLNIRSMLHGIDWSWWESRSYRFGTYHCDLADQVVDYSYTHFSLDSLVKALGGPGKLDGMDGSKVNELWGSGNRKDRLKILTYCKRDVWITFWAYLKWAKSRSLASSTKITGMTQALWKFAKNTPSLKALTKSK